MGSGERLSQSYLTYYKQYKSELSCMELGRDVSYIPQIINFDNVPVVPFSSDYVVKLV